MALVPATSTEATPAPPSMVIALLMVTAPNPPGFNASISPPAAVFKRAPAKVKQGAVSVHGLVSLPVPDTNVRVDGGGGLNEVTVSVADKVALPWPFDVFVTVMVA